MFYCSTTCLKLIFCSVSVKYEPISIGDFCWLITPDKHSAMSALYYHLSSTTFNLCFTLIFQKLLQVNPDYQKQNVCGLQKQDDLQAKCPSEATVTQPTASTVKALVTRWFCKLLTSTFVNSLDFSWSLPLRCCVISEPSLFTLRLQRVSTGGANC